MPEWLHRANLTAVVPPNLRPTRMSLGRHVSRAGVVVSLLGLVFLPSNLHAQTAPAGKPVVRFLIGSPGGFNQRGFMQEYAKALPGIDLQLVNSTRRSGSRLEEIQNGEADL